MHFVPFGTLQHISKYLITSKPLWNAVLVFYCSSHNLNTAKSTHTCDRLVQMYNQIIELKACVVYGRIWRLSFLERIFALCTLQLVIRYHRKYQLHMGNKIVLSVIRLAFYTWISRNVLGRSFSLCSSASANSESILLQCFAKYHTVWFHSES